MEAVDMGAFKMKYRAPQLRTFVYWMNERQRIYLARKSGAPFPWTADKILQEYKFTNVFRQQDRVTQEWIARYAKLLGRGRKLRDADLLFHCIMFRLFNWPPTYDALTFGMSGDWNHKQAIRILDERKNKDYEQLFTGAYIIPTDGTKRDKHLMVLELLDKIYSDREELLHLIRSDPITMEDATELLQNYNSIGPFIAYEIVCDLRHTRVLHDATDISTWANPGPGAKRGIHRLLKGDKEWGKGRKPDYVAVMRDLHRGSIKSKALIKGITEGEWPFEMREIEHSLCEFDKYMRVKNGEGKPRSRFREPKPQRDFIDDEEI